MGGGSAEEWTFYRERTTVYHTYLLFGAKHGHKALMLQEISGVLPLSISLSVL